jgi:hypothetical protein
MCILEQESLFLIDAPGTKGNKRKSNYYEIVSWHGVFQNFCKSNQKRRDVRGYFLRARDILSLYGVGEEIGLGLRWN